VARAAALAAVAGMLAMPGCFLFEPCPPYLPPMGVEAWSAARFGLANASAAAEALRDVGFAEVAQDGLVVEGSQGSYRARFMPEGNRTWLRLFDDALSGDFRDGPEAQRFVERHRPEVERRTNATVAALEARLGWPPFEVAPFHDGIGVC
jgi:hypothetical protein